MRILLYSRPFFPAVGGIETVSMTLARAVTEAGHHCTVLTESRRTEGSDAEFPFAVVRAPRLRERIRAVREADLVHSNGASLNLLGAAKLFRKPFIWTHQGYQLVAVDGLGWVDGEPAPLTPLASVRYHLRKQGLPTGAIEAAKLGLRRSVAGLVDRNVAITQWVADRQPLPHQSVIYNPFPLARFRDAKPTAKPKFDFLFVGRLVSEKGVRTLLRAVAEVNQGRSAPASLLIVGNGDRRPELEQLTADLGLQAHVEFRGALHGPPLVAAVGQGRIAVVPSEWEEAMGGVALELMAAGKPLIVSERGGLAECVGGAGLLFRNGDVHDLAAQMRRLLDSPELQRELARVGREQCRRFDESDLAAQYLRLYEEVLARSRE